MGNHTPVQADPASIATAEKAWADFVKGSKYAIATAIGAIGILLLVYIF